MAGKPKLGNRGNWVRLGKPGTGNGAPTWKRDDLGGRSTPITMRGKLYMILRVDPGTPAARLLEHRK